MADPVLSESVTVGGTPGSLDDPSASSSPGKTFDVKALAEQEYVAGSALQWYNDIPRALPWALSDVDRDFGADIWEKMLTDPQCRAAVNIAKASVMEEGLQLTSPVEDKDDDGYDQAAQMVEDIERQFADMQHPLDDVLWDMLDAVALGNRMAEQTFSLESVRGTTRYALHDLSVKPRESVAFVVDAYLNVLGILGRIPGQPFGVQQGMLLTDMEHTPNLLPRSKFAVLTFRPQNGDPRGTSLLRPAFDAWNQKQQLKREFLKYLTQFASPSLIGFTAEGADSYQLAGVDGTPATDIYGNPVVQSPEADMVAAMQTLANGMAIAFPFGADVKPLQMTGDGKPFLDAFRFLDQQIVKAVLHQTLATEEGQHQSRAASGTHKDILDTIIRQAKRPLERMMQRDVLRTWVRLNYGDTMLPLTPVATLGTAETEDLPRLWAGLAALQNADYLHDSQYADIDKILGLPERSDPTGTTVPAKEVVQVKEDAGTPAADTDQMRGVAPSSTVPTDGTTAQMAHQSEFARIMDEVL